MLPKMPVFPREETWVFYETFGALASLAHQLAPARCCGPTAPALEGRLGFNEAYEPTGLSGGTFREYADKVGVRELRSCVNT